jgi:hypothetical protein
MNSTIPSHTITRRCPVAVRPRRARPRRAVKSFCGPKTAHVSLYRGQVTDISMKNEGDSFGRFVALVALAWRWEKPA